MTLPAEIEGVLGWVVLTAPFALLLTIMLLGARRVRSKGAVAPRTPVATERYGAPVEMPVAKPVAKPSVAPVPPPAPKADAAAAGSAATEKAAGAPGAPPQAPAQPPSREPEIRAELGKAQSRGEEAALASLYNQLAVAVIAAGRPGEAGDHLRNAIRISSRLGQRMQHARARLELGDIAYRAGDLTTACEHWQLARGLYYDEGRAAELEAAEERMQRNGCPTDWVLNDF